jgi:RNA polymerase primary sigma factor
MNPSRLALNTRCFRRGIRPARSPQSSTSAAREARTEHRLASPAPGLQTARPGPAPADGGSRDIYAIYLQEIGQIPRLSPAQEIELATRIKQGDDTAREQLITANLRLVVRIAQDYVGCGVPLLDLISEGNLGLMEAVARFDPAKGAKLSIYAAWWIKQAIKRALARQGKTIRLPEHVVVGVGRLRQAATRLREQLGREPTEAELAGALGLSLRKVARLRTLVLGTVSLDEGRNEDDEPVAALVADEKCLSPDQELESRETTQALEQAFRSLSDRELAIVSDRFGLQDGCEQTFRELGVRIGLTRERIRQLQNAALGKLRRRLEFHEMTGRWQAS